MRRLLGLLRRRAGAIPVSVIAAASVAVVLTSATAVVIVTNVSDPAQVDTLATPPPSTPQRPARSATPDPAPTPTVTPSAGASAQPPAGNGEDPIVVNDPGPGTGEWQYAGAGPTFGSGGGVLTYRVAVEVGLPVPVGEFTALVDATLGDPRGWTGRGERRFQRVGQSSAASFTVYLASPWTAYNLCRSVVDIRIGGVPYTNCQAGAPVVINSDRYLNGASRFTGDLDTYRRYVINHEVGHRLGRQHVNCPGSSQLAPVMQQQTLGMQGCRPNAWPYPQNPPPPPPPSPSESPTPSAEPSPEPSEPTTEPTDPTDPTTEPTDPTTEPTDPTDPTTELTGPTTSTQTSTVDPSRL